MTISEPPAAAPGSSGAVFDVTDATFEQAVVERSKQMPVVVDLWAPWCGPCRTLGPMLEDAVEATGGQVVLAKVNVDENPQIAAAFQAQSIPAVHALYGGRVVDGFIGAQPQAAIDDFIARILPSEEQRSISALLDAGDEDSLRQVLELDPPNETAILALAEILVGQGDSDGALAMLDRIPDSTESRRIAASARTGDTDLDDVDARLDGLLDRVKADPDAKQEYLDVLELLGPDDPRVPHYRKALTARLY